MNHRELHEALRFEDPTDLLKCPLRLATSIRLMNAVAKSKVELGNGRYTPSPRTNRMPRRLSAAAVSMKYSETSKATTSAPVAARRRVLWPSPQPRSRPTSPETGGSIAKNAGVLTRSR
jgi:hypothetical protein